MAILKPFLRVFTSSRAVIPTAPHGAAGARPLFLALSSAAVMAVAAPLAVQAQTDDAAPAAAEATQPQGVPVTADTVARHPFTQGQTFSGRIEAMESVQLAAKVQGYLRTKDFSEGTLVEAGKVLFELDDQDYKLAASQAEAALGAAQAQLTLAQTTFDRQEELTKRDVQSRAALDDARAKRLIAEANVQSARVALDQAQLALSYTKIIAPLTGRIGRSAVSIGALISPQSGPLATIVQVDPVYVAFAVPQAQMLDLAEKQVSGEDVLINLTLSNGEVYAHPGKLAFADVQATASTDSVVIRATVPNPDGLLLDRGLVDVAVAGKTKDEVLAVPQQTLMVDQQGSYVMIVGEGSKAQQARVTVGRQQGGLTEITSGLNEGDQVIVGGLQKIAPGAPLAVSPWAAPAPANAAGDASTEPKQ